MSNGQARGHSSIFRSQPSETLFSSEESSSGSSDSGKDAAVSESQQIQQYVRQYRAEVEKKFKASKANAHFKLRRRRGGAGEEGGRGKGPGLSNKRGKSG